MCWKKKKLIGEKIETIFNKRHSILDGSMQVVVNIAVQRHTPWGSIKSRTARACHNLIVTWMLTESHTSTDKLNIFRRFCKGVREHRQHHLGGSARYQQFFGYLDDVRLFFKKIESEKNRHSISSKM